MTTCKGLCKNCLGCQCDEPANSDLEKQLIELKEIKSWLKERAVKNCRNCDGTGIFYGNVHICGCVNYEDHRE